MCSAHASGPCSENASARQPSPNWASRRRKTSPTGCVHRLGNSSACRRFQAVQASEMPATFCGAAGPTGDGVCGAQCESFCGLASELCTGDLEQWPDIPSCIADCMQFPTDTMFNASVTMGDSYACRSYHLTVAALDPDVHCPHIGLVSATCV